MPHDLELAARYAIENGKHYNELSEEELSMFDFDDNGELAHDTPLTRRLSSVYPRKGNRFPQHINAFVYIVQSTKKLPYNQAGDVYYKAYGMFFDRTDAEDYIRAMGFEDGDVEIIPCQKVDFRKSIWGWDVDGL